MKRPLVPRATVYELYWQFAAERQSVFEKRLRGLPAPWTDDKMLQTYKFCNVFRATDRVSQYLIKQVIYSDQRRTPEDLLFQIVTFRLFSRESTWEGLRHLLGRAPLLDDLASGDFEKAIVELKEAQSPIYTNAFILCANDAYGRGSKVPNHAELLKDMFLYHDLAGDLLKADSLQSVFNLLRTYPLYGNFMSYQTAIDLNYSELINFDENDFVKAGPGALRGIDKCFESLGDYTPEEAILWMVEHQDEEFKRMGLKFNGLFGRKLHAIDAQGLFCETDKYARVAMPELKSARVRMKQKFTPQSKPMHVYLPPKWRASVQRANNMVEF
jgi:hypothetical protein